MKLTNKNVFYTVGGSLQGMRGPAVSFKGRAAKSRGSRHQTQLCTSKCLLLLIEYPALPPRQLWFNRNVYMHNFD